MSFPALTTIFVPPSWCLAPTYTVQAGGDTTITGTIYSIVSRGVATECYPSGFKSADSSSTVTFSPGLCPSGYYIANQRETDQTTNAQCCPTPMSVAWWDNVCREKDIQSTVSLVGSGYFTAATEAAQAVFIEWRSTDFLNTSPTHPATKSAATISNGREASQTTSTSSHSMGHSTGSPSLSTGEKAGIGVGVAVAVLIIIAGAILVGYRFGRRRKKEATVLNAIEGEAKMSSDADQGTESVQQGLGDEHALHEAHGWSRPAELDPRNTRAELEGSRC